MRAKRIYYERLPNVLSSLFQSHNTSHGIEEVAPQWWKTRKKGEEDVWANELNVSVIKQIVYPNDLNSSNNGWNVCLCKWCDLPVIHMHSCMWMLLFRTTKCPKPWNKHSTLLWKTVSKMCTLGAPFVALYDIVSLLSHSYCGWNTNKR